MSLTSFLNNRDVIERFKQEFKSPIFNTNHKLLAPPLTKHYSMVGTAFDYLLRFRIERENPKAITRPWVAQIGAALMQVQVLTSSATVRYKIANGKLVRETVGDDGLKIVEKKINEAKKNHSAFLKNGKLSDDLIKSVLLLAQLDIVVRTGRPDPKLGTIDNKDVEDLRNITSLVEAQFFKAKKICLLNPTFGKGSELVGGADADLIIDDALIDIKTTMYLRLIRRDFNQLIGYYSLYRMSGFKDVSKNHKIKKIGIYYSRFGYLHFMNVDDVINQKTFPQFLTWFKKRAKEEQEQRAQARLEFERRKNRE
jgi:hypothetical protein